MKTGERKPIFLLYFISAWAFLLTWARIEINAAPPSQVNIDAAVSALQESRFDEAEQKALAVLRQNDRNARAHIVAALTRYKRTMLQLSRDIRTIGIAGAALGINHQYFHFALSKADRELEAVDGHLDRASQDPEMMLDLCLAAWREDWNQDGVIDDRDIRFFQVEYDAEGKPIPPDDPRRNPTFRFDHGDIYWARAMVNFQRSLLNLFLAYQFPDPGQWLGQIMATADKPPKIIFKLIAPERIHNVRDLILSGLTQADIARRAYLKETDDHGEWVPNPSQKNHSLPYPVDAMLYQTWAESLSDIRNLVLGNCGIDVAEIVQLSDCPWENHPQGFIHIKMLFEEPGDISIDVQSLRQLSCKSSREDIEAVLKELFGAKYQKSMKSSPLVGRLLRMKGEIDRQEETLERKIRYLLWLN